MNRDTNKETKLSEDRRELKVHIECFQGRRPMDQAPVDRLVRMDTIAELTDTPVGTWYARKCRGQTPEPVATGDRSPRFWLSEIAAYIVANAKPARSKPSRARKGR
jgi:predicted DNA-binding transcriptional regulator AlpA